MSPHLDRRQIELLLHRCGPVIHLRDADLCGIPRTLVLRVADRGELLRIGKSAFIASDRWDAASEWLRFRYRSIAFSLCIAEDARLTGPAAAVLLGLPTIGEPPGRPTAIRPGNAHTGHDRSIWGTVRRGYLPAHHRTVRDRARTVSPALAAVDVARYGTAPEALVVMDAVRHAGVGAEALVDLLNRMFRYRGIAVARWALEVSDPRAESPLESLGRLSFLSAGLPAPVSNAWIDCGKRWFRVDHLLPATGVVLEADGAVKYRNRPDADSIIHQEKAREHHLRRAGYAVARYSWSEAVARPWIIPVRAAEAARHRTGPPATNWHLENLRG